MLAHRRSNGFTLIELLVVITIIAILGTLVVVGIPEALRSADRTACQAHLKAIYNNLTVYQSKYKKFPSASGPAFVLAVWDEGIVDHNAKSAERFFCPSMEGEPASDLSNVTPEGIDYTGPNQEDRRKPIRMQEKHADAKVIICDRVPVVQSQMDLDGMPHEGEGLVVLYLGGTTGFIDKNEFPGGIVTLGEDSTYEVTLGTGDEQMQFKPLGWMVPDEGR
jgi:prepilin-type N-terminal cleavage/methylation domain-containing protein